MPSERPDFADYVSARWDALFRSAYLLTGDAHDAEELLQSTLVRAYAVWPRVSAADSVEAYLRRMLLNELLGARRKQARRRGRAELTAVPERVDHDRDQSLDLWHRLTALPPRQRAVIVLRYYEDLSEAEIAEVLGCSPGTVKSQAHHALRALRATFTLDEETAR